MPNGRPLGSRVIPSSRSNRRTNFADADAANVGLLMFREHCAPDAQADSNLEHTIDSDERQLHQNRSVKKGRMQRGRVLPPKLFRTVGLMRSNADEAVYIDVLFVLRRA